MAQALEVAATRGPTRRTGMMSTSEKECKQTIKQAVMAAIENPAGYEPFQEMKLEPLRDTDNLFREFSFRVNYRGESFMVRVGRR